MCACEGQGVEHYYGLFIHPSPATSHLSLTGYDILGEMMQFDSGFIFEFLYRPTGFWGFCVEQAESHCCFNVTFDINGKNTQY